MRTLVSFRNLSFLLLLLFTGCNIFSSGDTDIIAGVDTGATQYELSQSTVIDLTIQNRSSSTLYYSTCDSFTLEEIEGNSVSESREIQMPCECLCIVAVGETAPDNSSSFDIIGQYIINDSDGLQLNSDVRYRIFPHFYSDSELTNRLSIRGIEAEQFVLVRSGE